MPILAGIDEAGYGPNLGPMVQGMFALRVPDPEEDLWERLSTVVRKAGGKDGRLVVDDSKSVYGPTHDIGTLEAPLWHFLPGLGAASVPLQRYVAHAGMRDDTFAECIGFEHWHDPAATLPVATDLADWEAEQARLSDALAEAGVAVVRVGVRVCPPRRFNAVIEREGVKSAAVLQGVVGLLKELPRDEEVVVAVDRLGGRTKYGPMLQDAFPESWVVNVKETAGECIYRIDGEKRLEIRFQPKAEDRYLPVALASMLAKYLREVFMRQFNAHWAAKVPGIVPTAGYPMDAKRFLDAIMPVIEREKMVMGDIWRVK